MTEEQFETVKNIFSNYLEAHGQRRTKERYLLLEEIYQRNDHFDAETLFESLQKKKSGISRATVYNTLDLLVECGLVARQQFGDQQSFYEKSFGYRQHDHLICKDCGKVEEFCDPRIQQINNMMGELLHFRVDSHSLILYGECRNACGDKYRRQQDTKTAAHKNSTA